MKKTSKLMALELASGVSGWIWIGASIAATYYFVVAIFFSGDWGHFFWALGISFVGKNLLRGFEENKRRIDS